jgi:hypothetical protein
VNALVLSLSASLFTALSGLFFRVNSDKTTNRVPSIYLAVFYLCSLLCCFAFTPEIWNTPVNGIVLGVGASVGLLSSILMLLTSKALAKGPAAMTFAFQNASAIFPGLLLYLLLGSDFGYSCSYLQFFGMVIVLLGLYLGAKKEAAQLPKDSSEWLKYALGCFIVQILALTFIQGRCVLFDAKDAGALFSDFTVSSTEDVWFMPGLFGTGFLAQLAVSLKAKPSVRMREVALGSLGGIANFLSNLLLLWATMSARPFEQSILFPIFAVSSMVLCNLWANRLYQESFNYKTNALCAFGIFLAVAT